MTTVTIVPEQKKRRLETLAVSAVTTIVVLAAALWGAPRDANARLPQLLEWQVNSLTSLNEDDQAIHSALVVAGEEIGYLNQDFGDWPKAQELDELLIAPFYKDQFWSQHGELNWDLIRAADYNHGGDTGYLGNGGKQTGQSAFLLLFRHRHVGATYANQIDVWIHRDPAASRPTETKAESLVAAGWRQVVMYSGADELERLKGKAP